MNNQEKLRCSLCLRDLNPVDKDSEYKEYGCETCCICYTTKNKSIVNIMMFDLNHKAQIISIYDHDEKNWRVWSHDLDGFKRIIRSIEKASQAEIVVQMLLMKEQIYKNKLLEQMLKASATKDI